MEKSKLTAKDSSFILLISFFISQVATLLGQYLILAVFSMFGKSNTSSFLNTALGYWMLAIFQFASFIGVFIFYYKKRSLKKSINEGKLKLVPTLLFVLIGLITMFSLNLFINKYILCLNLFGRSTSAVSFKINNTKNYLISLISLALFPAIGEELIFRGLILKGLKEKGLLFATIVSSLMFTIFHFNLTQLYYPFLFGVVLAIAYIITDNIYVCMIMHFINNSLNITLQYFNVLHLSSVVLSNILMVVGLIVFIALLGILLFYLYKKELKLYTQNTIPLPPKKEYKQVAQKESFKSFIKSDNFKFYFPIIIMLLFYLLFAIV